MKNNIIENIFFYKNKKVLEMYSFLINYFCYSYHNKIYLFHFI